MADLDRGIYFIRCVPTGKMYVGSSVRIRKRLAQHLMHLRRGDHGSVLLQRAWEKHGETNFENGVLEAVNDLERLIEREQHWIDNSPSDFNVCRVAGRVDGYQKTPEECERQSTSAREKWADPTFRETTSTKIRKAWADPGLRAAVSEHSKKMWADPERRAEMSRRIREGRRLGRLRREAAARPAPPEDPTQCRESASPE